MYPPIEFSADYTERDRKVYTLLIHNSIKKLKTWTIEKIILDPNTELENPNVFELTIYGSGEIKLRAPAKAESWMYGAYSHVVGHGIAHHFIEKQFGQRISCNLIHYWANGLDKGIMDYTMTFRCWTPWFLLEYGIPYLIINMPNLEKLIADMAFILNEVKVGRAPIGSNRYIA